jgi:hypothetical protein
MVLPTGDSAMPASNNQTNLHGKPKVPVPRSSSCVNSLRLMGSRLNGKNVKLPINMHALPQGMPVIEKNAIKNTSHNTKPMKKPPKIHYKKLPMARSTVFQ